MGGNLFGEAEAELLFLERPVPRQVHLVILIGVRVWGQGCGFEPQGPGGLALGSRGSGKDLSLGFRVQGVRFYASGFRLYGSGFRVYGSFRVQKEIQGSGTTSNRGPTENRGGLLEAKCT